VTGFSPVERMMAGRPAGYTTFVSKSLCRPAGNLIIESASRLAIMLLTLIIPVALL
jgi:hypothetical protein